MFVAVALFAMRARPQRGVSRHKSGRIGSTCRCAAEDAASLEVRLRKERQMMGEMERRASELKSKMAAELAQERKFSEELKGQIASIRDLYSDLSDTFEMTEIVEEATSRERDATKKQVAEKTDELRKLEADRAKELEDAQKTMRRKTQNEERLVGAANRLTLQVMDATKASEAERVSLDAATSKLTQTKQQAEAVEEELTKERERLKRMQAEKSAALEKMGKMEGEIASAKDSLQNSYARSAEVFQRKRQLDENEQSLAAAPGIESNLQLRLQTAAEKEQALSVELEQLERESAAAKTREAEVEKALVEVKGKNEELNKNVPALESENLELKERLNAIASLEADEAKLASELSDSHAENEALASLLSAMKDRVAAREAQAQEAASAEVEHSDGSYLPW